MMYEDSLPLRTFCVLQLKPIVRNLILKDPSIKDLKKSILHNYRSYGENTFVLVFKSLYLKVQYLHTKCTVFHYEASIDYKFRVDLIDRMEFDNFLKCNPPKARPPKMPSPQKEW